MIGWTPRRNLSPHRPAKPASKQNMTAPGKKGNGICVPSEAQEETPHGAAPAPPRIRGRILPCSPSLLRHRSTHGSKQPRRRRRRRAGQPTTQWSEDLRPFPPEKGVGGESLKRRRASWSWMDGWDSEKQPPRHSTG